MIHSQFAFSEDADTVLFQKRGGDAVALDFASRKRAVIDDTASTGGTALLEDGELTIKKRCKAERFFGSLLIFSGDIFTVLSQNAAVGLDLRGNTRCGKSAEDLGADGNEMIAFLQLLDEAYYHGF